MPIYPEFIRSKFEKEIVHPLQEVFVSFPSLFVSPSFCRPSFNLAAPPLCSWSCSCYASTGHLNCFRCLGALQRLLQRPIDGLAIVLIYTTPCVPSPPLEFSPTDILVRCISSVWLVCYASCLLADWLLNGVEGSVLFLFLLLFLCSEWWVMTFRAELIWWLDDDSLLIFVDFSCRSCLTDWLDGVTVSGGSSGRYNTL